jgi:cytidylate kinase
MPVITVTRGALQQTFGFTEALAKALHCRTVAREDVINHGKQYGLDQFGLSKTGLLGGRPPAFWDRWRSERQQYLAVYKAALMDLVAKECVIYVGNIGRFILSNIPKLLRIRLDATDDYRIKHRMEESGSSEGDARAFVDSVDRHREEWLKFLYGVDYFAHANYDLILNLETLSIDSMVKLVTTTVTLPEFTLGDGDRKQIHDAHLEAHVLAAIAKSPRTRSMDLKVTCNSTTGTVNVIGVEPMVGIEIWKKDIEDTVSEVKGVRDIRFER